MLVAVLKYYFENYIYLHLSELITLQGSKVILLLLHVRTSNSG